MACEECGVLNTHALRSRADLVHALQVAATEVDRGALQAVGAADHGVSEQVALHSALASGALPNTVHYRFRCALCGDRFELRADTRLGQGAWTRNAEGVPR